MSWESTAEVARKKYEAQARESKRRRKATERECRAAIAFWRAPAKAWLGGTLTDAQLQAIFDNAIRAQGWTCASIGMQEAGMTFEQADQFRQEWRKPYNERYGTAQQD